MNAKIKIRTVFNRNSQDPRKLSRQKIEGDVTNLFYRIFSEDGCLR